MSQEQQILKILKSGETITPMKALYKFGCFRLGARIFSLKSKGHDIKSTMVEKEGKHFAEYSLVEK